MTTKPPKRPRDTNQLAKLVVEIATGRAQDESVVHKEDSPASTLGRMGGLKGGRARADKLTATERSKIARAAAITRWAGNRSGDGEK